MRTVKIECTEEFLKELYLRIIDLENHDVLRVPSANEFIDLEKRVEKLENGTERKEKT